MTSIFEIKKELAYGCMEIYKRNLVKHGEGNVSLRIPNRPEMIITPAGNNYSNPLAKNMVHLSFTGSNFDPELTPSSEYHLHQELYEHRPRVQCILHNHSPFACTLAVLNKDLLVIVEEMAKQLGGPVKCADFACAGSTSLPKKAIIAMENRNAVLLANHGVLVVGRSLDYCIKSAIIVEKMAKIYCNALQIGPVHTIDEGSQQKFLKIFEERYSTN
jgi:L-fuculose-phosphate aldolase